ncbi:MAG: outer membrane beta-barrel protein [Bacteroidales bacterium]|nr:outer membrane beta-barrel protein [Bacteroidales bacterium]
MKKFFISLALLLALASTALNGQEKNYQVSFKYLATSLTFSGFGLSFSYPGFGLEALTTSPLPFNNAFLNYGLGLTYYTRPEVADEESTFNFRASVPIDLSLRFPVNEKIALFPFLGVDPLINLGNKYKGTDEDGDSFTTSMFQVGTHFGVTTQYDRFLIKLGYYSDLSPYVITDTYTDDYDGSTVTDKEKFTMKGVFFSVGYSF